MQGSEIWFADQNLGTTDPEKLSKNEVITKFKHFIKVNRFKINQKNLIFSKGMEHE
jgi:hypothetical protein